MSGSLLSFVADELGAPVKPEIEAAAVDIARRLGGVAVLFYGSVLRTGDLDGVLDFYVLTPPPRGHGARAWGTRLLWPDVSFQEVAVEAQVVRAKVATMPLATFARASRGRSMDTTIWTRFTQPANLVWAADEATRREVAEAIVAASITAARFAAVVGPHRASAAEFWKRLFQQTYRAELRVERPGREEQIIAHDRRRYDTLLPLAWQAAGIGFEDDGRTLAPHLSDQDRRTFGQAWRRRRRTGKLLNTARLLKASMTFEGAARYGAWKVERHTGVPVHLTPWRERHPVLAAPGVLFRVWRSRRAS